jgi:hypothetical protein
MTDPASSGSHSHKVSPAAILLIPVVVALVLTLFAWPASRQKPRDLPIGVAGPAAATAALDSQLAGRKDAFDVHHYADEATAREAIKDRDVYGAFVASRSGLKVLTASGASVTIAQLLQQAGEAAAAKGGSAAQVQDVVPGAKEDPRGSGLASSVLPLVLAGLLIGCAAVFLAPSLLWRMAVVVAGSLLAGFAAIAIAQGWLGILEGPWVVNALVLSLVVLAIGSVVAGFGSLLGVAGIGLGLLLMLLIGNPWSGVSSAPEMLPQPVGEIGQLLPPGAGGNLVRSTAFFDNAAAGGHLAVLLAWVGVGLLAMVVAAARQRRRAPEAAQPVMAS